MGGVTSVSIALCLADYYKYKKDKKKDNELQRMSYKDWVLKSRFRKKSSKKKIN